MIDIILKNPNGKDKVLRISDKEEKILEVWIQNVGEKKWDFLGITEDIKLLRCYRLWLMPREES